MNTNYSNARQNGSVLLEALISILIFSIGILGLVGMQATAINTTSDAQFRSNAGFLVDQMIGTVWATKQLAGFSNASNVTAAVPDRNLACNPCNIDNPSANANANIQAWASSVQAAMPQGGNTTASVVLSPSALTGPIVTVTISWRPPNLPPAEPPHRHYAVTYIN